MDQSKSKAFVLNGCEHILMSYNNTIGYDTSIEATNCRFLEINHHTALTAEAASLFRSIETTVDSLNLEKNTEARLRTHIQELKEAYGTSSFTQKYQEFVSFIANHVEIFQALNEYLPRVTQLLC